MRHHAAFGRAGTNVNVVHVIDGQTLRMRTYERGVEAETLACGTGAVASAITGVSEGWVAAPVTVVVSSGQALVVQLERAAAGFTGITLTGEARFVASGTPDPEGLA